LFKFETRQKIFQVGSVKIGGQPGELPTVLIGSLFHRGHKIVKDRTRGLFDEAQAEHLIRIQEEMSETTGVPCMLDVVAEYPEALSRYIDFVAKVSDAPFLVNGPNPSVRIAAVKHAQEVGLLETAVYNSINYTLSEEEVQAIKETGVKAALIQAFNPRNPRPEGMISILRGEEGEGGLLERANDAGIEKALILTPILDVPSIGPAAKGICLVKEEFGVPTGTAPIGVVGRWRRTDGFRRDAKKGCRTSAAALVQAMGADFIIYGSIAKARHIFPACAMIDATIAYTARGHGIRPLTRSHPVYTLFRQP